MTPTLSFSFFFLSFPFSLPHSSLATPFSLARALSSFLPFFSDSLSVFLFLSRPLSPFLFLTHFDKQNVAPTRLPPSFFPYFLSRSPPSSSPSPSRGRRAPTGRSRRSSWPPGSSRARPLRSPRTRCRRMLCFLFVCFEKKRRETRGLRYEKRKKKSTHFLFLLCFLTLFFFPTTTKNTVENQLDKTNNQTSACPTGSTICAQGCKFLQTDPTACGSCMNTSLPASLTPR